MSARTALLGVDTGTVRIGLAISDPDRKIAFPLTVYERSGRERDAAYFRAVIEKERVGGLVIGLPVHTNGQEGVKALEAREFGTWLGTLCGLPVIYWDERFTTVEAESAMWAAGLTHKRRKERRDKVAAQLLLQAYLDAGCPIDAAPPGALEG